MENEKIAQLEQQIIALSSELEELKQGFFRNNFSQQQIFNKYSDFTDRIKIPVVSALAATAEVGELCAYDAGSGYGLYICYTPNTWAQLAYV